MNSFHRYSVFMMIILVMQTNGLWAGDRPASRRAMSFLQLGAGPRAYSMGEAFTGLADDVTALSWNPGGLSQISDSQILFMHNQWISNLRQEYLAGTYPVFGGCAGAQVSYLNSDIQTRRDEDGVVVGDGFNPYSMAAGLGFAIPIAVGFSAGGSLNYAREQLDDVTYQSGYLDVGGLYRPENQWWSLGLVLQNAGLPVAGYSLPLTLRLGSAARFFNDTLYITADIARTLPGWFRYGFGTEYWYRNIFALRVGYLYRPEQEGLDSLSGLRVGLGFNIQGYQLDYALIPQGDLGYGHRASFTYFFGGGRVLVSEKQTLLSKARQKGKRSLQAGNYEEAIDHYQKVLTFQPSDIQAAQALQQAKLGKRKQEQQMELQDRFSKADQYIQEKQYTDAMDEYQRILLIDSGNTLAATALKDTQNKFHAKEITKQLSIGRSAFDHMQWADALLAWQAILAIDKTHSEAQEMLGKTRKEMVKGNAQFKDPRIQEWYLMGLTLFEKGDYFGAIQKWNKVLEKAPKHVNAKKYKTKAVRLRDEQISQWLAEGAEYIKSGELVKAAGRWRKVLTISPNNVTARSSLKQNDDAFHVLAKKLYVQGIQDYTLSQLMQAIANWQDCLTLIPDYPGAKENIQKAKAKQKALQ